MRLDELSFVEPRSRGIILDNLTTRPFLIGLCQNPDSGRCVDWIIHNAAWRHTTGNKIFYIGFFCELISWRRSTVLCWISTAGIMPRMPACQMERRPRSCTDWLRKDSYLPNISFLRKCYPSIGLTIKKDLFSVRCQSAWVDPKTISRETKCKQLYLKICA